jgi:DNA (cytosine-5)-methyltransferase 1
MVGAVDMCPLATETYKANFPGAAVVTSRLEDVNIVNLKRRVGKIDILLASPECTNHTCAKGSAPRNEESRATAMHAVQYARAFKPRWLVLENVIYMRPWSRYDELKKDLERLGYKLEEQILDASDFGVAQARRRLFLVGDLERSPNVVQQKRRGRKPTARGILDRPGTWQTQPLYSDHRARPTIERAERGFKALGKSESFLLVYYGSDGGGGWQPLDRPLRTITTVDRFALIEPSTKGPMMRMLQVPELKRAMGFEDSFDLCIGTRRQRIKLLGNGVCPPVMARVVSALIGDA